MGIFEAKVCVCDIYGAIVAPSVSMIVFGVIVNLADFVAGLFFWTCVISFCTTLSYMLTFLQYNM